MQSVQKRLILATLMSRSRANGQHAILKNKQDEVVRRFSLSVLHGELCRRNKENTLKC